MGVTTGIILDTRRPKKDGSYPVKLRLIYDRKARFFSTGYYLTEDEFNLVTGKRPRGKYKDLSFEFINIEKKALSIIRKMDIFTFEMFKKLYYRKPGDRTDLFFAFRQHLETLKKNQQVNTAETYRLALNSLRDFTHRDKLPFADVTPGFLNDYEAFMLKSGKSPTTVSIYVRCVRRLFNLAIMTGDIDRKIYPFGAPEAGLYQPPQHRNIKKALSKSDLKKIFDYKPVPGTPEHFYRDLWLFSYLCNGMNMADILRLRYENITGDTILFVRHKTAHRRKIKPVIVEITDPVQEILERWGTKPAFPHSYIFNVLTQGMTPEQEVKKIKSTTRTLNSNMKRIAKRVGIQQNISTYTARHSFAQILKLSGESIAFISESLGHSNLNTTENYLSSFDSEQRKRAAKKLTDFND